MIFAIGADFQSGVFLHGDGLADIRALDVPERLAGEPARGMRRASRQNGGRSQQGAYDVGLEGWDDCGWRDGARRNGRHGFPRWRRQ